MLDNFLDFDEWKRADEDPFYDWRLIRRVRIFRRHCHSGHRMPCPQVKQSLRALRAKNDARGVLGILGTCIRNNFAGVESPRSAFLNDEYGSSLTRLQII